VSLFGIWNRAHSTPLELIAEVGIPLAASIFLAWAVGLLVLLRGVRARRRDREVPAAALSVACLAPMHSMVDFSLQIPGLAIMVLALAGAGLAQSFSSEPGSAGGVA
jgi:hypothetical protein